MAELLSSSRNDPLGQHESGKNGDEKEEEKQISGDKDGMDFPVVI